jgi:hypothetical protein
MKTMLNNTVSKPLAIYSYGKLTTTDNNGILASI